jgi:pyruvate dehydrogenase E1 component alpha subunit
MIQQPETIPFFVSDRNKIIENLGQKRLHALLEKMMTIRQLEIRAEAAYLQGKIGGFLHLYIGEEAIQTAATEAAGLNHWFTTTYRCHALAYLLGETPTSILSELFGKVTGNAQGRGGSMHLYMNNMLGGEGIVGGHIPMATGAGFTCKYLKQKEKASFCFLGDGAIAQGTFHESLNLASLMKLPCLYVIENNKWSMGTPLTRTIANHEHFLFYAAKAYGIPYYKLDGMDFFNCYAGFQDALKTVLQTETPVIIECSTDRFRGHSVSDPGLYRSKEEVKECAKRDPILLMKEALVTQKMLTEEDYISMENSVRQKIIQAVEEAEKAPWPEVSSLEQGVFA